MLVPGLLQTERYAREVIRSVLLIAPPSEIERRVRVMMDPPARHPCAHSDARTGHGWSSPVMARSMAVRSPAAVDA
jgi:hypothetical protein